MALTGHFLMIKAYEVAEAGTVQPFAYFQLVFIGILGLRSSGSGRTPGPSPAGR